MLYSLRNPSHFFWGGGPSVLIWATVRLAPCHSPDARKSMVPALHALNSYEVDLLEVRTNANIYRYILDSNFVLNSD